MPPNTEYSPESTQLSIFYPLYNEEKNIIPLVEKSIETFQLVAAEFEIILVNDGSKDKTEELAQQMASKYPQVRVVSQPNLGYGGAVKRGLKECQFDWVFFSDGDLQFDLAEIELFLPYIDAYDLVIGYRLNRAEGFKRTLIAKMLKIWNFIFLGFPLSIKDIDCAFKLINRRVLNAVGELKSDGAMMTTEFLLKAYKQGFRVKQVGVHHYPRKFGSSTGSNFKVISRAVRDTFVLRRLV